MCYDAAADVVLASQLLTRIKMLTGVVEVGLFCHMAKSVYFGNEVCLRSVCQAWNISLTDVRCHQDGSVTAKFYDGHMEHYDKPCSPTSEVPPLPPAGTAPPCPDRLRQLLTALVSSSPHPPPHPPDDHTDLDGNETDHHDSAATANGTADHDDHLPHGKSRLHIQTNVTANGSL